MIVVKKDFVDENTESYCAKGKRLTSGKAYYLKAADGTIYFGGRQCAETHGTNDFRLVPDFTKSLVAMRDGQSTGGGSNNTSDKNLQDKINAITYLLLREELLRDFKLNNKSLSYKTLNSYYKNYQANSDLNDSEVKHILNIEKTSSKNTGKAMSLKNLSTCHAYHFIMKRAIYHSNKKKEML